MDHPDPEHQQNLLQQAVSASFQEDVMVSGYILLGTAVGEDGSFKWTFRLSPDTSVFQIMGLLTVAEKILGENLDMMIDDGRGVVDEDED